MTACKYCRKEIPLERVPSGDFSRRKVCDACRPRSFQEQAAKAKETKREQASQQQVACRKCFCPILTLRLDSGRQEQRRVCARCQEERQDHKNAAPQRKREQIKAWVAANKERVRRLEKAWKSANKERISEDRRKLMIEDVRLVRAAARSHYDRFHNKKSEGQDHDV